MEKALRNKLRNIVVRCRELLEKEFAEQLEGIFGVRPDGTVEPLETLSHLDARRIRQRTEIEAALDHLRAAGVEAKAAVAQFIRESAFTFLNRIAALKLMEQPNRAVIMEAVGSGRDSKGFRLFQKVSPEIAHTHADGGYRFFLQLLFEDLAKELGVLFDPSLPQAILFPRPNCLDELLSLLNDPEIASAWAEDETIGWVYQYFTPKELRDQARKESQAPRNSYELAFRNQFYTPRYVVQFLTDNTLGRMWYEMRRGETRLAERCRYMVRRPVEVFLRDPEESGANDRSEWVARARNGDFSDMPEEPTLDDIFDLARAIDGHEVAKRLGYGDCLEFARRCIEAHERGAPWPASSVDLWLILFAYQDIFLRDGPNDPHAIENVRSLYAALRSQLLTDTSGSDQENPWRRPVYIPFRPKKDPRSLRILDPACGSGHFLLYAFDLLITIYEEAYDDPDLSASLSKDFPDRDAFRREIPRLIIEHNLHGIDIDLRATQIAAMALWLRVQRAYHEMGIKVADRPRVTRCNIVCAEPMPGEREFAEQFINSLALQPLRRIVAAIWQTMQLAGEAGTLLRIEKEMQQAINRAWRDWVSEHSVVQMRLFERGKPPMQQFFVFAPEDEKAFWEKAEDEVLARLKDFAAQAGARRRYQRRLFAEDAARGIAFLDLLRQSYDVVLMNPPFGAPSKPAKPYIDANYPRSKADIYAAFVERGLELLTPRGMLGAITSRTGLFLTSYKKWREEILLGEAKLTALADLGYGVLDTAMVETAAYCLEAPMCRTQR